MALRALRVGVWAALAATSGYALELKQETLKSWNSYLDQENIRVKQRVDQPGQFFWVDQEPDRMKCLREGELLVAPFGDNPIHIAGGLIHHWVAAVFISGAHVDDVLAVTRDYARFKDYYKPGVEDAALMLKNGYKDEFLIRFANQSILSKISLEGTYVSEFVRLSDKRWYSVSQTTSMREIKGFGTPNEKRFPPGQGSGYIWRFYSTARMENRDGGVLLEMEAIALSRDIPTAIRWCVDPIVRRISRDSIEKSLTQTSDAVHQRVKACEVGNPIIGSGDCSQHANHSSVRSQKLAIDQGR